MKDIILKQLQEIEKKENITILYAIESGSRAWGFESTDSDYDVRFIYVRPLDWYLSIDKKRDVLTYPVEDLLDFHGWDIQKTLQLFTKSNPPLYEWLVSPIVYKENKSFSQKLRNLANQYYSLETSMYNYLNMSRGENKNYLQDKKIKLKKYFYALRPLFACMWIEKFNSLPPMEFNKMMEKIEFDKELETEIKELIVKKKNATEANKETRIELINIFIDNKIKYFEEYVKSKDFKKVQINMDVLNKLFIDVVTKVND